MSEAVLLLEAYDTELVPHPVEYAALVPAGTAPAGGWPLVYFLHGGGGSRDFLVASREMIESAWQRGLLPPCVVVTPSVGRSFYMDYRDGTQRWETLLCGTFLDHIRATTGAGAPS